MEVNPNISPSAVPKVTAKPVATLSVKAAVGDSASFGRTDAVNNALQQVPDVRTDAVMRARALLDDNDFPPPLVLNAISKLIATQLNQNSPQE
jgi:hypothetical protein